MMPDRVHTIEEKRPRRYIREDHYRDRAHSYLTKNGIKPRLIRFKIKGKFLMFNYLLVGKDTSICVKRVVNLNNFKCKNFKMHRRVNYDLESNDGCNFRYIGDL